ncbi:hypothetical protein [Streptomyces lavendulae]|uniref:hypothetical protein n=1 Tax=Streptomyces lavendulae TaxID=1914 RepID=UPI0033FDFAD3
MDDQTTPRPRGPAQIILALSPADGLVAVPVGEQYRWADTALRLTPGFERRSDSTYALHDVDNAKPNLLALAENARRHRVLLFGGARPYLGDYAAALAADLPGSWTVKVEVLSHPVWQEDLVPLLWDAGELIRAVEHGRIPYSVHLDDGTGRELLLVERPGSAEEYVLGAFASAAFDDNYDDPSAPSSVVLPSDPALAATLVAEAFLPSYEQAVHTRLLAAVEAAHDRLEELHGTWTAIEQSGRYSDGILLDPATLEHTEQQYLEEVAVEFRRLHPHAAELLARVGPVTDAEDSAALGRLHQLLHPDEAAAWPTPPHTSPALPSGTGESLRRWRTDALALLRQALASRPPGPAASARARPALPAPVKAAPSAPGRTLRNR